jgi:hypothetical protein
MMMMIAPVPRREMFDFERKQENLRAWEVRELACEQTFTFM